MNAVGQSLSFLFIFIPLYYIQEVILSLQSLNKQFFQKGTTVCKKYSLLQILVGFSWLLWLSNWNIKQLCWQEPKTAQPYLVSHAFQSKNTLLVSNILTTSLTFAWFAYFAYFSLLRLLLVWFKQLSLTIVTWNTNTYCTLILIKQTRVLHPVAHLLPSPIYLL